ncbi:MAG: PaaI family thioesterase [Alphaproteobacteria bacterium]
MTIQDASSIPPDQNWHPLNPPGLQDFEELTGPLFVSSVKGDDEPIRIGFRIAAKHCNSHGFCHGGMIATFMDMATGLSVRAATKLEGNSPTMTLTIDFMGAGMLGDWIESRSRFVHATYKTAFCDSIALGPKGPVARANGIFRLNRPK